MVIDMYGLLILDLDQFCKVNIFVNGRFLGSLYCSNLKFCMRIYILY